jgi:hypothetical protein
MILLPHPAGRASGRGREKRLGGRGRGKEERSGKGGRVWWEEHKEGKEEEIETTLQPLWE